MSHYLNEIEGRGEITINFTLNLDNVPGSGSSTEVDDYFSSGTASVMTINFLVFDSSSPTIINLKPDNGSTEIRGYNPTSGESYAFDLSFWSLMESLTINF